MTRVLVIGAGHNGLVAAIHLASAGLDVTVLEHAPRPGGATASFTRDGFVHDHCAGFVPMTAASPAMRELDLDLDWIDPATIMAHPFDDGTAIALHRDLGATVDSLGACGDAWAQAMRQLLPQAEPLVEAILSPLPPVVPGLRVAAGLNVRGVEWLRRGIGSVEALGLDVFSDNRRATAWLAGSAQHSGLPPTTAVSGAFGLILQLLGHSHGWPIPRGGMGAVSDALARRAEGHGARIVCDATVDGIVVRGDRVAGVLARLVPDGALPGRLHRRLRRWRYSTGAFKLDYALSGPMPWTAEEPRGSAVVHIGAELEELAAAAEAGQRGEVPERPALVVGQQSLFDDSRAPGDAHTLYVYGHVPSDSAVPDAEIIARIEAQLERFAPGFGSLVLHRVDRPPAQTEKENPSLVGGDLAGGSYEIDQQLIFRPAPEMCRYRSPLEGLYVAGASTHPGGAVHGMSGRGAARALIADQRRPALHPVRLVRRVLP